MIAQNFKQIDIFIQAKYPNKLNSLKIKPKNNKPELQLFKQNFLQNSCLKFSIKKMNNINRKLI